MGIAIIVIEDAVRSYLKTQVGKLTINTKHLAEVIELRLVHVGVPLDELLEGELSVCQCKGTNPLFEDVPGPDRPHTDNQSTDVQRTDDPASQPLFQRAMNAALTGG